NFSDEIENIHGIEYHRTHWPPLSKFQAVPMVRQMAAVAALTQQIKRLATELKADVIHAHSPSLNGLAVAQAAGALNLPWVYELRYYEEDAAVDRGKTRHNSLRYRLGARMEQQAMEQATAVVTISQALREDLIRRDIPAEKITVVPNGVDTEQFQPLKPDAELMRQYNLAGKLVIGFIGSFYFYEGLEFLVDATLELLAERRDITLLLVGEGEAKEMLQNKIATALREHFLFTGNIPHDEVQRHYSLMDVVVYPRKRSRLTELTTPLKPLEAMAMEKALIGSNVGGLRELFGEAGALVEAENSTALAERIFQLLEDESERKALASEARQFVLQRRDWKTVVQGYGAIYEKLATSRLSQ
ncbi:MAG TPA: glycosyltransferase family 4 protein, partial [Blastocatellia bacterium]|nr:glycosyltransferase family 4 protein [Blastocatellia bacterium]